MLKNIFKSKIFLFILMLILILLIYQLNSYLYLDNKKEETLIFMANKNIAPIVIVENNKVSGIAADIAREIGNKIDYNIKIEVDDWSKAQERVLSGQADALIHINHSSQREEIYDFSKELLRSDFSIFKKHGDTDIYTAIDLIEKKVGIESAGYPQHLLNKYNGINLVTISDWSTAFKMLKSGQLDAIVADRWIGEYELAKNKVEGIQILDKPIERQYSRIAVAKGNDELLNLINNALAELEKDGTIESILDDWQGKKVIYFTKESIRGFLISGIIIILFSISLLSLYSVKRIEDLNIKLELDVSDRTKELNEANKKLRISNRELEKISTIDPLTHIYNRRHFDSLLQKEWKKSLRENLPLSLIMIDIDNFKVYNDTYGHIAGDDCLKSVAYSIKNILKKPDDIVARFGGEEFVVLMPNTSEDSALYLAEEIRFETENLSEKKDYLKKSITVSLGLVTSVANRNIDFKDLINAADKALYKAKEEGKNRIVKGEL